MSEPQVSQQERDEFFASYTKVLVAAWTDEDYAQRLDADPAEALREFGLEVPAGGELVVTRSIPEDAPEPSEDAALSKWASGHTTGIYTLSVPATPALDLTELSEADLMALTGGWSVSCCSSCPCCCCA